MNIILTPTHEKANFLQLSYSYEWPGKIPVTEWLAGSQQEVIMDKKTNKTKKHIFRHHVLTALAARYNGVCLQTTRVATPIVCAKCPMAGLNNSLRNAFRFLFSCSKAELKIVNEVPYLEYDCKHLMLNMIIRVPKEMPLKFAGEHQWVIYNEVIAFEI